MEQTCYVRLEIRGTGQILVPVTVSDEPWKGDLAVTGPEAVTPRRITDAARRKIGLPLLIGETERLFLRELSEEDLPAIRGLKLWETDAKLLGASAGQLCDAVFLRSYVRNQYPLFGFGIWGVFVKNSPDVTGGAPGNEAGTLAGLAGFGMPEEETDTDTEGIPEIGYYIAPSFRRKGYAEEACRLCLLYAGEELGLEEVLLRVRAENRASLILGKKLQQTGIHSRGQKNEEEQRSAAVRLLLI